MQEQQILQNKAIFKSLKVKKNSRRYKKTILVENPAVVRLIVEACLPTLQKLLEEESEPSDLEDLDDEEEGGYEFPSESGTPSADEDTSAPFRYSPIHPESPTDFGEFLKYNKESR